MEKQMNKLENLDIATATKIATNEGNVVRVIKEDDQTIFATADIREDRVNLFVRDGKVVASSRG